MKGKPRLEYTIDEYGYKRTIWVYEDGSKCTSAEATRILLCDTDYKSKSNRRLLLTLR